MPTIFEELGQESGIREAVEAFNDRLLADPKLAHYFVGVDQSKLRWHHATLLSAITGGTATYDGRDLGEAHARLGITAEDFLRVVGHLVNVLETAGIGSGSIDAVVSALALHKDTIVSAETAEGRREAGRGR